LRTFVRELTDQTDGSLATAARDRVVKSKIARKDLFIFIREDVYEIFRYNHNSAQKDTGY
jgi:hypothetical protein